MKQLVLAGLLLASTLTPHYQRGGVNTVPAVKDGHDATPILSPAVPAPPRKNVVSRSRAGEAGAGSRLTVTCYVATGHRTASGLWPRPGMAASNTYPFGTRLLVEGVGVVQVQDRIGHGSQLDLYYASRDKCLRFGRRRLLVQEVR